MWLSVVVIFQKMNWQVPFPPLLIFEHNLLETSRSKKSLKPALQIRPRLSVEPDFIDERELADKWQNRKISQSWTAKHPSFDYSIQIRQEFCSLITLNNWINIRIALRIFRVIKCVFEQVYFDQVRLRSSAL